MVAYFKLRTGDLLIKQGCETDPDWINASQPLTVPGDSFASGDAAFSTGV